MADDDLDIIGDLDEEPKPKPRSAAPPPPVASASAGATTAAPRAGASRRSFLIGSAIGAGAGVVAGAGIVGVTAGAGRGVSVPGLPGGSSPSASRITEPVESRVVTFTVNGQKVEVLAKANFTLAEVLRHELDLTGTKIGCNRSECSACTVLVNNTAVNSCSELAIRMDGAEIVTIEGLEKDGKLHPVQAAFVKNMGLQCGFCTPGQVMQTVALLQRVKNPSVDQITHQMAGNLCKCSAYPYILASVQEAAKTV